MSDYDVIVIGAGPGGYVAAIRAAQLGLKTAVIEKKWIGGVCLNVGCIPSKALLKNADVAELLHNGGRTFGFSFDNLELDYAKAVQRSRKVSQRLTKGVSYLLENNDIDVHMGAANLVAPDTVEVTDSEGQTDQLQADHIVVATGANPIVIPGMEVDGEKVITYTEAILQEDLPDSVVIVGSGAIGVEFATIWNAYGVDVTIVEMLPNIVPLEDADVSKKLLTAFKRKRVKVMTNTKVEAIETTDAGVEVQVSGKRGEQTLEADQALLAIGFKPNSKGLGLEDVGVELNDRGAIEIDERMATNVEGIWAIGDVTAKLMLAHVASAQGIICAENIAGVETITLDYDMMPRATYCHPQVASFGLTEEQAKERGHEIKKGQFSFRANGKALGLDETTGFVKLLSDAESGELLGAHLIGPEVTELLPELTLAQRTDISPEEIARNVHAHPTLSEAIMEAAHALVGHPIHT
jgi:dihydrolipoamide dehydrogenase